MILTQLVQSSHRVERFFFLLVHQSFKGSTMNNMHLPSSSRSMATAWNFPLGIEGFRYADLNRVRRLMALDQVFREELRSADEALADRYERARADFARGEGKEDSELLIAVARHLDLFLAKLFDIEKEVYDLNRHTADD